MKIILLLFFCTAFVFCACERSASNLASLPALDLSGSEKQVAAKIERLVSDVKQYTDDASGWGKLAMNLDVHDFQKQAIPCYERAITLDSTNFRWLYYYAMLLRKLGDEKAIYWFEQSRSRNPNYTPVNIHLGNALLDAGKVQKAARVFAHSARLDSSNALAYTGLARISMHRSSLEQGREQLLKAIKMDSLNRDAYGLLAEVERRSGRVAAAETALRKAQKLPSRQSMPDSVYDQFFREGVSAQWYRTRGEKLFADGFFQEAAEQFKQGLNYNPSAPGYFFLGELYDRLKEDSLAAVQYRTAIRSNATFVPPYVKLGKALYRLGKYEPAIEWSEKGLRMNPRIPEFYDTLAKCFVATNRVMLAMDTYKRGLELTHGDPFLATRLAWLLATAPAANLRDGGKAIQLARFACEKTKNKSPEPIDALAAAYAEVGRFQLAVELALKAHALAKSSGRDKLAKNILGRVELYRNQIWKFPQHKY